MKKIFFILSVIVFGFSSCKKEVCCFAVDTNGQEIGKLCFDSENERNNWETIHLSTCR